MAAMPGPKSRKPATHVAGECEGPADITELCHFFACCFALCCASCLDAGFAACFAAFFASCFVSGLA